MATCFMRDVAPDNNRTLALGTPSDLAKSSVTARLASPPSATARTRTFTTLRPFASVSIPSISSRPPRGVTRRLTLMPVGEYRQGSIRDPPPTARSEHCWINVIGDHPLDEHDDQNQDDRRDVEPTEIGQDVADRGQQGLGDPVQKLRHR